MKPRCRLCRSALWPLTILLCLIGSAIQVRAAGKVVLWGAGVVPAWTNAIAIAAGGDFSLALRDDGTVLALAWDYYIRANDLPSDLTNITAIAAGAYHGLALRTDGTVALWAEYCCADTNLPSTLSNVVAIAAGGGHSLALEA